MTYGSHCRAAFPQVRTDVRKGKIMSEPSNEPVPSEEPAEDYAGDTADEVVDPEGDEA